jgi:hypothetical protein
VKNREKHIPYRQAILSRLFIGVIRDPDPVFPDRIVDVRNLHPVLP